MAHWKTIFATQFTDKGFISFNKESSKNQQEKTRQKKSKDVNRQFTGGNMQINEIYKNIATTLIRETTLLGETAWTKLKKKKKEKRNLPVTSQMFSVYS